LVSHMVKVYYIIFNGLANTIKQLQRKSAVTIEV
jgi:hypothetical protein